MTLEEAIGVALQAIDQRLHTAVMQEGWEEFDLLSDAQIVLESFVHEGE